MIKRLYILTFVLLCEMTLLAQEPKHHLRQSLFQLKQVMPAIEFGWEEENGEKVFLYLDEDEYNTFTYSYYLNNGQVTTEALIIGSKGVVPHDTYISFLSASANFYNRGGYTISFVKPSILAADAAFKKDYSIIDSKDYFAEFDYSDFVIVVQYEPQEKLCYIIYMIQDLE